MSAPLVAAAVLVLLALVVVALRARSKRRRTRYDGGVISAWSRHPATRKSATVRVLRDPDEVAQAADRAVEHDRVTAQRISARMDRMSRLSRRLGRPGN